MSTRSSTTWATLDSPIESLFSTLLSSAILFALCACTTDPPPVTDTRTFTPTVNITFDDQPPLMYGELRPARVTVTNSTFDPILFRSVELEGQLPFIYRSPEPLAGRLKYESTHNRFVYDPSLAGETESLFADNMLLLPGESVTVEHEIRLRFFQQKAKVIFQRLPMADLLLDVYFPTPDPHNKNSIRFRKVRRSGLNVYRKGTPETLERVVILPDSTLWPMAECENEVRINIRDHQTPGTIVAETEAPVWSPVTAWTRADLWIVDDPKQEATFAVREDGSTFPLPRCDLRIFDVLDTTDDDTVSIYTSPVDDRPRRVNYMEMLDVLEEIRVTNDELHPRWAEHEDGTYFYGLLRMTPVRARPPTKEVDLETELSDQQEH